MAIWLQFASILAIPAFAVLLLCPAATTHVFALGYRRAAAIMGVGFVLGIYFVALGATKEVAIDHMLTVATEMTEPGKSVYLFVPDEVDKLARQLARIEYFHAGASALISAALAYWVERRYPVRVREIPALKTLAYCQYALGAFGGLTILGVEPFLTVTRLLLHAARVLVHGPLDLFMSH